MKNLFWKFSILALPSIFFLTGCHPTQWQTTFQTSCTVSGPQQGACTIGIIQSVTIAPNAVMKSVEPSDLATIKDGSYTLSISAPSSVFTANASQSTTTTISVTTDTGYSSSITLLLTPTAPAIAPVNSGDTVFSFNLPDTPAFDAWMQNVTANTIAKMSVTTQGAVPLVENSTLGIVTITTVLTSNSTGDVDLGDLTFNRVSPPQKCGPESTNPSCPVPVKPGS
ncbi:MAG: hypothetical protein ABSC47_00910 [Terracidiphilus sp.]|jgi:hypothetical protein